jgi:adenosylhomocysteine nucleosidase
MADAEQQAVDAAHADLGVVCALPMEMAAFLDRCERVRKYVGGPFVFRGGRYDGIRIAVVQSGMGFSKARRATLALIDAHSPPWVLSCGFCGALRPEMKVGHIVMADSIIDTHGQELRVDLHVPAEAQKGLHVGRVVTTDDIVRTIAEKQELAAQYQAIAVDLESLAVAQVCSEVKRRFLCVRAVSDDLSADLPPEVLSVMGETGSMRLGAALGAVWKRPGSVKEMWHLRENAQLAAERLASVLDGVLRQLAGRVEG